MQSKQLEFTDLIWREFRMLTIVGGVYGFFHTKMWAAASSVHYIMMYSVVLGMVSLLAYTTYLLLDHLSYMSQALHMLICGLVATTASLTLTIKRGQLKAFAIFYTDPKSLCEYARTEYFEELMKKTTRKKNKMIITWLVIYGTCAVVGVLQPVFDKMFGVTSDVDNVNGAWLNLPFILWWPIDIAESRNAWLIVFFFQGLYMSYIVAMVVSAVVLCFATIDRLIDQIKLIIYSIKILDKRAKDMFRERYPGSDWKLMEKEYDVCYYDCLVQNVKHHHKIIMWLEEFMDVASLPVAVPIFGGAILLGMALITITEKDDPRVGPKALAASLAFSEAYNIYILCDVGQQLQQLDLFDALYFCKWSNRSEQVKRTIKIMRIGCMRPIKFTAAKILVLNMELFADLVNSAYSIFNLKAASKEIA